MKLVQMEPHFQESLKSVRLDSQLSEAGFKCKGKLTEYEAFSEFNERLWVWIKIINEDSAHSIVTYDLGNGYCNVEYYDMYIPDIFAGYNHKHNCFKTFLREEANFRLTELGVVDKDKLSKLTEKDIENISESVCIEYMEKDIFDYDYMDDILNDEVDLYIKNKNNLEEK